MNHWAFRLICPFAARAFSWSIKSWQNKQQTCQHVFKIFQSPVGGRLNSLKKPLKKPPALSTERYFFCGFCSTFFSFGAVLRSKDTAEPASRKVLGTSRLDRKMGKNLLIKLIVFFKNPQQPVLLCRSLPGLTTKAHRFFVLFFLKAWLFPTSATASSKPQATWNLVFQKVKYWQNRWLI